MTTLQQILKLASQGEPSAIAFLISNSLKAQGITARANLKGDCLRVILESSQVPDQAAMVAFIRQGMKKLGAVSIKRVTVYGKQADTNLPAWSQNIDLGGASTPEPYQPNSVSGITSSTQISKGIVYTISEQRLIEPQEALKPDLEGHKP